MEPRINYLRLAPGIAKSLGGVGAYVAAEGGLERGLIELVDLRVSQINHCAFCVDMHVKEARALGETDDRLHLVAVWADVDVFTDRERAAFLWAEAVTNLTEGFVPDDVYNAVAEEFTPAELAHLTLAICVINSWNRLNVSMRIPGGHYQPRPR
ncbi:MAG: carboxymuconolactone decarboxylase family protein [Dehalococcoidia bacterium]|nr:carboxymuconolactone decarboxylase family protein [Dehalococcoidia bacterium]